MARKLATILGAFEVSATLGCVVLPPRARLSNPEGDSLEKDFCRQLGLQRDRRVDPFTLKLPAACAAPTA